MIIKIILVGLIFVIVGMAVTLFCVVQKTPEEREKEDDEQARILVAYTEKKHGNARKVQ
jgi:flagellar basal body-associated protein FliL